MDSFTLTVPIAQFKAAVAKAEAAGVQLPGEGGALPETDGVSAHYTVSLQDSQNVLVTVVIDKKPFFVSVGMIEGHIKQLLGLSA